MYPYPWRVSPKKLLVEWWFQMRGTGFFFEDGLSGCGSRRWVFTINDPGFTDSGKNSLEQGSARDMQTRMFPRLGTHFSQWLPQTEDLYYILYIY